MESRVRIIENLMVDGRILVALSGGIDSAAAVLMLREKGYEVTGLYIDMLGDEVARSMAESMADRLGVELVVENVVEEFRTEIINYTLEEHGAGRTPSPCVRCNPRIKWRVAERVADSLGIRWIATGHYVRIEKGRLRRGVDSVKDQSYYLWELSDSILNRAVTPLGDFTKIQVREYLSAIGGFEDLSSGGESMSICFVGKQRSYGDFLRENIEISVGEVVDSAGRVVGCHDGFPLYTIGQKRGFTGNGAVVRLDAMENRIVVSNEPQDLYCGEIVITEWRLVDDIDRFDGRIDVVVRGLGRNPSSGLKAWERICGDEDDDSIRLILNNADAWAVAPGQPVVLYAGDMVVGGGYAR